MAYSKRDPDPTDFRNYFVSDILSIHDRSSDID